MDQSQKLSLKWKIGFFGDKYFPVNKETDLSLPRVILPEGLLTYFDIIGFDKKPIKNPLNVNRLTIYLEEKKQIPEAYKNHQYKPSGFTLIFKEGDL